MKRFVSFVAISLALANAMAQETNEEFFGYNGSVGTFSKVGFNNALIPESGIYPTDTFTTLFGRIDTTYNFKAFIDSSAIQALKIGVGIVGNGLVYDSTAKDGLPSWGYANSTGSGLNSAYVGAWYGNPMNGTNFGGVRNYILHNAYLDFQSDYFNLKGGRYESGMDYFSGYTQGFNADIHFKVAPNDELKFWWFSSWGRAFAYSQWFLDFYSPKYSTNKDGKGENLGIHSGGMDYVHNSISDNNGVKDGMSVLFRPWTQFYASLFNAAGGKLDYQQYFGNGYGVGLTIQGYALNVIGKHNTTKYNEEAVALNEKVDKLSGNLNVILKAYMFDYNMRLGVYKNFGSANSQIGTYGNPLGIDQWTASVYDIGPSLNDITSRNAVSVWLSGGGAHGFEVGTFSWEILARYTQSPRSDEQSVALFLSQAFKNGFAIGLKLEYLRDTTKAGYTIYDTALSAKRTDDRSHAFITLDYNF